jgi:hypothetical protein
VSSGKTLVSSDVEALDLITSEKHILLYYYFIIAGMLLHCNDPERYVSGD